MIHEQDMFEPSNSEAKRWVLMQPIVNTRNVTIGVMGLMFDSTKIAKDIADAKLDGKEFIYNEIRIYSMESSYQQDKLIYQRKPSIVASGKSHILDTERDKYA